MQWNDNAILLSARKHGETSVIARLLTARNGLAAGVIRGAQGKKMRGAIQPGNVLAINWQARLPEQLGTITCELLTPHPALLMTDAAALSALSSACTLVECALPEHHPYPRLYRALDLMLARLHQPGWQAEYIAFELTLLAEAGFGLDLHSCAATGKTEELIYVSPKSGRAVSRAAGAPYHDKMLHLPAFLHEDIPPTAADITSGMNLTAYFLQHWLLEPHGRKMPPVRQRLLANMLAQ